MQDEIINALTALKQGGTILYPTDTVWGIGCDATNAGAIDQIYTLKERSESKSLICLVSDFTMLNEYIEHIPEVAYDILKYAVKPTTIVYDNPIKLPFNLIAQDNTLAVRVTQDEFCKRLIKKFGKPIISTSANISGEPTPKSFAEIAPAILKGVDYVVNLRTKLKSASPSTIIRLKSDGQVEVIRQ